MDFSAALHYPFKSIPKVLTIVLISTIGLAFFLAMILNSYDWIAYLQAMEYYLTYDFMPALEAPGALMIPGILGLIVVLLLQGIWLSGYGIRVISGVLDESEKLPGIVFTQNLKDGFYVFLASIWYALIAAVFVFGFIVVIGVASVISEVLGGLLFLGGLIVGIPAAILLGWAYFVGIVRFAADDNREAIFQVPTNYRIAKRNWKTSLSLTGHQFLLGILFWFVGQAINNGLQLIAVPVFGLGVTTGTFLTVIVLFFIVSFTINIVQQFSSLHLLAQYARNLDIMSSYRKVDF